MCLIKTKSTIYKKELKNKFKKDLKNFVFNRKNNKNISK